jgi:hydroxycarboxylate dehydrogenase B
MTVPVNGERAQVIVQRDLVAFAAAVLRAIGADPEIAAEVARHLVGANLAGHDSHGVFRLIQYANQVEAGELVPDARPELRKEGPTLALFDARRGFGQWSTRKALEWSMTRAREHGVAAATIRHSMHAGRLGDYVELACEQRLAAILCLGMAGPGSGRVAPFGAGGSFMGTNPWAIGVPATDRPPLVADFATSAVAEGKIRLYRANQVPVPPGLLLAPDGTPSTTADDLYRGGALLPLGGDLAGHKGSGLGLAAAMLGALCMIDDPDPTPAGTMSARPEPPWAAGVLMVVLDPDWFGGAERYARMVGEVLNGVGAAAPGAGFERVLAPGEPEARSRERRSREGIPISAAVWDQLADLAGQLNVPLPARA